MNALDYLINALSQQQVPFTPNKHNDSTYSPYSQSFSGIAHPPVQAKTQLMDTLSTPLIKIIHGWSQQWNIPPDEVNKLEIFTIGRKYSLYASLLTLLYSKYNYLIHSHQKDAYHRIFIDFIISQLEKNQTIKKNMRSNKLRVNQLIQEIKDDKHQTADVIYYLTMLFDINIYILTEKNITLYFSEETYDNCKPHVLLYRNTNQTYYPIIYQDVTDSQLLLYHDQSILQILYENFSKKIICGKNYLKKNNHLSGKLNRYKVAQLRKLAEENDIEIKKTSTVSGHPIYRHKSQLVKDLSELGDLQIPDDS